MFEAILVALALAVLLAIDWRYCSRVARVLAVTLALVLWWFSLPNYTIAGRRASAIPAAERVTQLRGDTLSQYMSGVATMREAMLAQQAQTSSMGLLGVGVLVWLACSPLVRRKSARETTAE